MTVRPASGKRALRELSRTDLRALLVRVAQASGDDDVISLSAAVAFKMFLSLFPVVLAMAAVYALTRVPADVGEQISVLARYLPSEAQVLITESLVALTETEQGSAVMVLVLGVLGGTVSATGAAATLIRALNRAMGIPEQRTFLARRAVGLGITAALFLALGCVFATIVLGPFVRDVLIPPGPGAGLARAAFNLGRVLLALAVLMVLADFVYWVGPNRPLPPWRWLSPGSVVAVLGWFAASAGFRAYLSLAGDLRATYGYVAGVIVLLLWFQLSMLALLIGAELNAELQALRPRTSSSQRSRSG